MPPTAAVKSARTSIYGWTKKRSVSPAAILPPNAQSSKSKPPPLPIMATPVKKTAEDDLFYEDEYRDEIEVYMHYMESITTASAELMDMQPELQWFMRPYLIDFLVEIHQQFRLRPEVLYLAINIVDRYVSKRVVYKKHYQLVGCAALWIAAKFEDGKDRVPLVKELADMCCKAYDESAFIQMEGHVLSTIGWCIGHPTAEAWLRLEVSHGGMQMEEAKVAHLARFFMETTLFHREFVGMQSSIIASGALLLARSVCGRSSSRQDERVVKVAKLIDVQFAEKLENVSEIVVRKYAPVYYARASTIAREWYLSGRKFSYNPSAPATPISGGLPTPGLAPSGSWPGKRGSFVGSPSSGYISGSSSEAGDDAAPLTPITPVHSHVIDPFAMAAKENIAPAGHQHMVSGHQQMVGKDAIPGMGPPPIYHGPRPVLHQIGTTMGDLAIPNRPMRRLSN
ncbi:hypothetical protein P7C73_g3122, partial [Tremellales sp. Uapishka_1]